MVDEKLAQSVSLTFKHSKIDNLIEGGNIHCKRVMSSPDKSPTPNDGSRVSPKSPHPDIHITFLSRASTHIKVTELRRAHDADLLRAISSVSI